MRTTIITLLILLTNIGLHAQVGGLMNKVKNKVNQNVNQRVDRKIDNAINKTLDGIEGEPAENNQVKNKTINAPGKQAAVSNYSRYDFIPGEKILYQEDFSQDALGELPMAWNSNGKAEVVTLDGIPGKWMRLYQNAVYLSSNKTAFTKNYTIEFDLVAQLANAGYTFPLFNFGFLSTNELPTTDNSFLQKLHQYESVDILFRPAIHGTSYLGVSSNLDQKNYFKSSDQKLSDIENYYHKVAHIAIQVQETRLRIWVNKEKLFDIPKALAATYMANQVFFKVGTSGYKDDQIAFYINNVKIATGIPDTRHKLIEEGTFSTNAILFDVNTANLKPESYGVINEIAKLMNANADLKIRITGHTDSDGSDDANLVLSKKRSKAVMEVLSSEYKVDVSRMESAGEGESKPIADNQTKEGKAQNRRVEFTKL